MKKATRNKLLRLGPQAVDLLDKNKLMQIKNLRLVVQNDELKAIIEERDKQLITALEKVEFLCERLDIAKGDI
jgi:hypothetical protein